ncbi:DUF6090 family protein [Bizionia arctica]|uniref:Uncharacterized protein n=1 Tax=Bizionia arctica TaxID=1495645 RepID=A0A917GUM8_9FLAO|nr:DUF6090 family protein [Bizionia arctica]GGG57133.1 hypothetical protein GCM10010976_29960 [Bizionia arctica]
MIKLFRKIRKNFLNEGKTTRYFKYAIGEIILVVIGILIALQINNWNENRKSNIEETAILESLYENLVLAKQQSDSLITEEMALKQLLIFVLEVEPDPIKIEKPTITDTMFKNAVWDVQNDLPIINTYINLKNTNKLSLIKNKKINEKFSDLDFQFNRVQDILADRLSVHQVRIDDILENDINFIPLVKSNVPEINIANEIPTNYQDILNEKRIRNLIGMKLTFTQDVIDRRKDLDREMRILISLIETELHK